MSFARTRGWAVARTEDVGRSGAQVTVMSTRLGAEVSVANRWFPKIRSWVALGAPLELVSALSVLRILTGLWIAWLASTMFLSSPSAALLGSHAAEGLLATVILVRLLRRHVAGRLESGLIVAALLLASYPGVLVGSGPLVVVSVFTLGGPLSVYSALFQSKRTAGMVTAAIAAQAGMAASWHLGSPGALVIGTSAAISLGCAQAAILLMRRSLDRSSTIDPETGLLNGAGLEQWVADEGGTRSFVLAVVCVSGLAEVREALGFTAGRELLRRVVEDVGQVLPRHSAVGRVEGDEVVVILGLDANTMDAGRPAALVSAEGLAGRLLDAVGAGRYLIGALEISLRARVGLALCPWDGLEVSDVLRRATHSARTALHSGQTVRVWDGARDALTADDLALLADLRQAPERRELHMAYQVQVSATTGRVVGVEALMRWQHPVRGAVPPGQFITLAERTGLVDKLTEWSLSEALDAQVRWRDAGIELPVAVNLSALELVRPDLALLVLGELRRRGLPPDALTVEITETAAAGVDIVDMVALLEPLAAAGVRVSIDDFGTGYTALGVLPHLPLSELKIDLGFVQRSAVSAADAAIVRSVADLGHRMGLAVVAEGIEDAECAARMAGIGCDVLQGYHHGRPMVEEALLVELSLADRRVPRPPMAAQSN